MEFWKIFNRYRRQCYALCPTDLAWKSSLIETTVYSTDGDVTVMVDWSLEGSGSSFENKPERKTRRKFRQDNSSNSKLRKSKPLVSAINQHLLHSRNRQVTHRTVSVRKVKRDSFGNVVSSRWINRRQNNCKDGAWNHRTVFEHRQLLSSGMLREQAKTAVRLLTWLPK